MSLRHWLQLALTEGIGPILTQRLIDAAMGVDAACEASPKLLRKVEGIGGAKSQQIFDALKRAGEAVDAELERAAAQDVSIISRDDDLYPALLKSIPDPPSVLYVRGSPEPRDLNALAVVGSRRCSFYGREQAERLGALLAGAGVTVVSGGARGVDSAAHRGAISHPHGRTIAVLGCGVDTVYPPENAPLFDLIRQRGAVMSEYPLGTPPLAENFPRRNRIVSGMSRGVLVIEADARSGALITARQACDDHGRPVFALPGRVDNRMSAGPHLLIRDGATLVACLEDILDGLGPLPQSAVDMPLFDLSIAGDDEEEEGREADEDTAAPEELPALIGSLSAEQQTILDQLDGESLAADAIIERSGLPAHVVMRELTMMSLKGLIRRVDGQTYAKRP
jgi:DNA processing protein